MSEQRTEATLEMATDLEWIAREIAGGLERVMVLEAAHARNAERHLLRLRFSIARVHELQERVARTGGVFEPARLEVAVSILDTHIMRAESFLDRNSVHAPAMRRVLRAMAADADAEPIDDTPAEERAA
jgi:hypothetical protein